MFSHLLYLHRHDWGVIPSSCLLIYVVEYFWFRIRLGTFHTLLEFFAERGTLGVALDLPLHLFHPLWLNAILSVSLADELVFLLVLVALTADWFMLLLDGILDIRWFFLWLITLIQKLIVVFIKLNSRKWWLNLKSVPSFLIFLLIKAFILVSFGLIWTLLGERVEIDDVSISRTASWTAFSIQSWNVYIERRVAAMLWMLPSIIRRDLK